jgi:hypothetical protein
MAFCWRVASRIALGPWLRIKVQADRMTSGSGSMTGRFDMGAQQR